jgi:hypothetical protein
MLFAPSLSAPSFGNRRSRFFDPRTAILSADKSSTNFRLNYRFVVGFLLASIALSLYSIVFVLVNGPVVGGLEES